MKLEAGKNYRTRDGRKARCLCTDLKTEIYQCAFAIEAEGEEFLYTHTEDGSRFDSREDRLDIISEWRDEPVIDPEVRAALKTLGFKCVAMDKDRKHYAYKKTPTIGGPVWLPDDDDPTYFRIANGITFTGEWTESLTEL